MLTDKQLDEFERFMWESRLKGDQAKLAFEIKSGRQFVWADPPPRQEKLAFTSKHGDPRKRSFTQFAARVIGGHNALNAGRCPTCSEEIAGFRNDISEKEFSISGMCQKCQDSTFGVD